MKAISPSELNMVLKKTSNRQSPRSRWHPNEYLKYAGDLFKQALLLLFNNILTSNQFPSNWCMGNLITIFKKGDRRVPSNDRPIVLLNSITKLFSTILATRLKFWQEKADILPIE